MSKQDGKWWDESWNPVTGCSPVSAGCDNCWAERMSKRHAGRFGYPADRPFRVTEHPDRLGQPGYWRKPRRVFVCGMGDLFHRSVPHGAIRDVFQAMCAVQRHQYYILTKRPEHMAVLLPQAKWLNPMPHIMLGTSIESQEACDRLKPLKELHNAGWPMWVSWEPLLDGIRLPTVRSAAFIDWAVVGVETGPGARECHESHLYNLVNQLWHNKTPVWVKAIDNKRTPFTQWPKSLQVREWPK